MINARAKGATYERKIANALTGLLGVKFARTPGSGAFGTRNESAMLQGDVICTDETFNFPFLLELKRYKEVPFYQLPRKLKGSLLSGWLTKLVKQMKLQPDNYRAVLIFKEDRKSDLALVQWDDSEARLPNSVYIKHDGVLFKMMLLTEFYDMLVEELL